MIHSIGLDIVEIERVRRNIHRFGARFVNRVLGAREAKAYERRPDGESFLAGRLAAKEAIIKGLGQFLTQRPALSSIEVLNDAAGAPHVHLPDAVTEQIRGASCLISLSHEKKYAAAVAVFQEGA